ncbi:MAG: hypothetical protein GY724_03020 [Actinomycetia bacterium]|nr:hypothetical protein [Actinomycetes bacterium]MCP4222555.1 hypothetical protein [Actinomycetes bacterium]MCP5030878.1 hypothetical protein [Actinomycetes bacterium]
MIAAHVPNLFDRSRFKGRVTFVETPAEAKACSPILLIVDLDRCEDLVGFRIDGTRVVGFGPRIDSAGHERAIGAGYHEVFPRSVFFRRLGDLLDSADPGDD